VCQAHQRCQSWHAAGLERRTRTTPTKTAEPREGGGQMQNCQLYHPAFTPPPIPPRPLHTSRSAQTRHLNGTRTKHEKQVAKCVGGPVVTLPGHRDSTSQQLLWTETATREGAWSHLPHPYRKALLELIASITGRIPYHCIVDFNADSDGYRSEDGKSGRCAPGQAFAPAAHQPCTPTRMGVGGCCDFSSDKLYT
jgi:hypothetical protein